MPRTSTKAAQVGEQVRYLLRASECSGFRGAAAVRRRSLLEGVPQQAQPRTELGHGRLPGGAAATAGDAAERQRSDAAERSVAYKARLRNRRCDALAMRREMFFHRNHVYRIGLPVKHPWATTFTDQLRA